MSFGKKKVNIIEGIGNGYDRVGIKLLHDNAGNKMEMIKHDERTAEAITRKVLTRWIRGEGRKPTSWATLATVLDECNLCTLSKEIRSVKTSPGKFAFRTSTYLVALWPNYL